MKLIFLFLFSITVVQAYRKTPKDGRHLIFISSSSSTSSEEATGKGRRFGEDTSGQSPRTDNESVNESEEDSRPSNWGKRPHDSDSEDSEEEEWNSEEEPEVCTGTWTEWTSASRCNDTCGNCGIINRSRSCYPSRCRCSGPYTDQVPCANGVCPFPRASCCPGYKKKVDLPTKSFYCG
ncbi:hypothetical protein CAEBREN_04041 [Caenorhabditis brenneri]|uniref:Uncharacterized protein n=1 Tax=Caenorhabditis brenneri TaxID=135651 RepID=G0PAT6_CAEBE|nr:hypothetical protein CAEBREN_04041 [Caenorhabditis brenneri]